MRPANSGVRGQVGYGSSVFSKEKLPGPPALNKTRPPAGEWGNSGNQEGRRRDLAGSPRSTPPLRFPVVGQRFRFPAPSGRSVSFTPFRIASLAVTGLREDRDLQGGSMLGVHKGRRPWAPPFSILPRRCVLFALRSLVGEELPGDPSFGAIIEGSSSPLIPVSPGL